MSIFDRKTGQVISTDHGLARVRVKRTSSCATCSCAGICSPFGKDWMVIEARNMAGASQGQEVVVTYEMEDELKASFILYIIPLFSLILGAVAGAWLDPLDNQDLSSVTGGFGLLCLTYLVIRAYSRKKYQNLKSFTPVIQEILARDHQET
ncbi:SoxR reducing system RseC family protein [Desulfonatronovibrio hydrogenovorans]|uniref:SoxR reducing system RseC family protein n=1 Tax=Desulfonatronovibrio hydrogenovorans TaxID=53245 RepID=UPI00048D30E4|nr:SoxR reducing system RseC family protein [Desulfonatronovibrio hydrogenovorans]